MKQNKILQVALTKTEDTNKAIKEFFAKNKIKNKTPPPTPLAVNQSVDTDKPDQLLQGPFITQSGMYESSR